MRGAVVAVVAVVLLGFWGCGGDEFNPPVQSAGAAGQAGTDGGAGQAGSSGAAGMAGAAGQAGAAGNAGGGPSAEDACQQYSSAYCDRLGACAPALLAMLYGDVNKCVERYKPVCIQAVALPDSSKTPAFAATCGTALKTYACDLLLARHMPDECLQKPGARPEGKACGEDGQCATGYCKYEVAGGCGVCRNRASAGGVCAVDGDCGPGLTCPPKVLKCTAYGELDSDCSESAPCRLGLSCVGATATLTGKCQTARLGGEQCEFAANTKPACDLMQGYVCNLGGLCEKVLYAKGGEECGAANGGYAICTASAKCDPNLLKGVCTPAAGDGETCDNDAGPYCMPLSQCIEGKCTPPALSLCN